MKLKDVDKSDIVQTALPFASANSARTKTVGKLTIEDLFADCALMALSYFKENHLSAHQTAEKVSHNALHVIMGVCWQYRVTNQEQSWFNEH